MRSQCRPVCWIINIIALTLRIQCSAILYMWMQNWMGCTLCYQAHSLTNWAILVFCLTVLSNENRRVHVAKAVAQDGCFVKEGATTKSCIYRLYSYMLLWSRIQAHSHEKEYRGQISIRIYRETDLSRRCTYTYLIMSISIDAVVALSICTLRPFHF